MGLLAQSKPVNKQAVLDAAEELMREKGNTSSLEVKQKLRKAGFFATQTRISEVLSELRTEQNWSAELVSSNGERFWQYSIPATAATQDGIQETVKETIMNILEESFGLRNANPTDTISSLGFDMFDLAAISVEVDKELDVNISLTSIQNNNTIQDVINLITPYYRNKIAGQNATVQLQQQFGPTVVKSKGTRKFRIDVPVKTQVTSPDHAKANVANAVSNCSNEDWFVHAPNTMHRILVFDANNTSDHVRTTYARLNGIKIQKVRARRIKNLK